MIIIEFPSCRPLTDVENSSQHMTTNACGDEVHHAMRTESNTGAWSLPDGIALPGCATACGIAACSDTQLAPRELSLPRQPSHEVPSLRRQRLPSHSASFEAEPKRGTVPIYKMPTARLGPLLPCLHRSTSKNHAGQTYQLHRNSIQLITLYYI